MKASKEQLIRLLESRDVRRRRKLYEYYEHYFQQQHSARFTIELINADLGYALVNRQDVKYIRAHCNQWKTAQPETSETTQQAVEKKSKKPTWTNQEELKNPSFTGSKLDSL
ncbi:hypothetical protein [Dyadobacter sp. CY356]|uniref:hypothetical protein n=1 Tax=Dyadobacter sp. CY356 TaxID=2906442 RepID=UPI001F2D068D|nr:hypothetical protein [Dyadobacter sp. CY356]MCF0055355.1 hypothetical protein [Dyadobacter sp. CY356]